MDDYIAEILRRQWLPEDAGDLESLQRRLLETAEYIPGARQETSARSSEEARDAAGKAAAGQGGKETAFSYLQRIQKELDAGEETTLLWSAEGARRQSDAAMGSGEVISALRARQENETSKPSGTAGAAVESVETRGAHSGMTPEELSMFFQRDARRYS